MSNRILNIDNSKQIWIVNSLSTKEICDLLYSSEDFRTLDKPSESLQKKHRRLNNMYT